MTKFPSEIINRVVTSLQKKVQMYESLLQNNTFEEEITSNLKEDIQQLTNRIEELERESSLNWDLFLTFTRYGQVKGSAEFLLEENKILVTKGYLFSTEDIQAKWVYHLDLFNKKEIDLLKGDLKTELIIQLSEKDFLEDLKSKFPNLYWKQEKDQVFNNCSFFFNDSYTLYKGYSSLETSSEQKACLEILRMDLSDVLIAKSYLFYDPSRIYQSLTLERLKEKMNYEGYFDLRLNKLLGVKE